MKTNHTKLPMSSNKDISENIQVAEEWRNLNGELWLGSQNMEKENKICCECKLKPIWKGTKQYRNFWGLFCEDCESLGWGGREFEAKLNPENQLEKGAN